MFYLVYLPLSPNNFVITSLQYSNQKVSDFKNENILVSEDGARIVAVVTHSNISVEAKEAIQLSYFKSKNVFNFYMNFDYTPFDPFILVCYEDDALFELNWNGKIPNLKNILMSKRYLWSLDEETDEKALEIEKMIFNEEQLTDLTYFPDLHRQLREKLFLELARIKNFSKEVFYNSLIKNGKSLKLMYDDGKNSNVKEFPI